MLGTSLQLPNGLMVMPDTDVPQDHYICNGDNKVHVSNYDFKRLWDNAQNNEELSKIIGKLKVWPKRLIKYENISGRKKQR